jgi:MscS family membrane protein
MFGFLKAISALLLFSLAGAMGWAQLPGALVTGDSKPASTTPAPVDPLGRTTPRSSIHRFLEACHEKKYAVAAQYLDLRRLSAKRRASEGSELAQDLKTLLDRNYRFQLSKLSDSPDGDKNDALAPNIDELATFDLNGETVKLNLERVNQQPGGLVWLVSSDSVSLIPELNAYLGESALEKHLPSALVNTKLLGTPLWVWLALVLLAVVLSAVSRWLSKLLIAVLKPVMARYVKSFHPQRLEAITEPLRLLVSVTVFRTCLAFIAPTALLRDVLLKLLTLLFILGAASLLMRLVDVVSDTVISRLDHRERALTYSIFPLGIRFVKILIFSFGVLIVLQQWGYNTSTILAGLGVGGIAIALAAQKTIENLFGGISLISDRPVLVGDVCQFGGQQGTVEDIGLRSTRIRTNDRTLVTVPNSQFSTMTLENYSRRDRMWFHPTVRLRRDTSPEQVRKMMDAITEILKRHEKVDASGVPLRFSKISDQSLDLDIFAYVQTTDGNEFLKVQTELLLQILEVSYSLGIGLAVPFQEGYNVSVDAEQKDIMNPYLAFQAKNGAPAEPNSTR